MPDGHDPRLCSYPACPLRPKLEAIEAGLVSSEATLTERIEEGLERVEGQTRWVLRLVVGLIVGAAAAIGGGYLYAQSEAEAAVETHSADLREHVRTFERHEDRALEQQQRIEDKLDGLATMLRENH